MLHRYGSCVWEQPVDLVREFDDAVHALPTEIAVSQWGVHEDRTRRDRREHFREVEGQFAADSDPNALWEIIGETPGKPSPQFAIVLRDHRFFAVLPMQPDSVPFIHIRRAGEVNKLSLDVAADQQATLRINDEIAWRGVVPAATTATIHAAGTGASHFILRRIALYAGS